MLRAPGRVISGHARCRWCGGAFVSVYGFQWLCENYDCAEKQMAHAMMTEIGSAKLSPWLYLPTPFGVEMHEAREQNVLGGGAAGGAKSYTCRWDLYAWCRKIPGYKSLLLRRTFPELDATHLGEMEREQYDMRGAKLANRVMSFENGSFVKAGHCDAPKDMSKYLSTEYDDIRFEEASTFEPKIIREISSRARTSNPLVRERGGAWVRLYSNPGNVGSVYLKEHYLDHAPDPLEFPTYDPTRYRFIRARISDNPYLDPDYISRLSELDPSRRRQLLDGDWDVFDGQFFHGWAPKRDGRPWHVRSMSEAELGDAPALCAVVWGYNRPGCVLWARVLPSGRIYIQHDMKFQHAPIESVATDVRQRTRDYALDVRACYAPPEMFPEKRKDDDPRIEVEAPSQVFSRHGVTLTPAGGDGTHGWQRVHDFLRAAPDGQPWLVVDPTCVNITRTLPTLEQSESDPDDCDGEDYAARALRSLLSSRPSPFMKPATPREPEFGTLAWFKQQDRASSSRYQVRRIGR